MPKTLSVEQKYLLGRIPNRYDLRDKESDPDSEPVRKARKLVAAWDARQAAKSKARMNKVDALVQAARDAVYFSTITESRAAIARLEALRP